MKNLSEKKVKRSILAGGPLFQNEWSSVKNALLLVIFAPCADVQILSSSIATSLAFVNNELLSPELAIVSEQTSYSLLPHSIRDEENMGKAYGGSKEEAPTQTPGLVV